MKVNPIISKVFIPSDNTVKATKTEAPAPKDKLEISGLAKTMNTASQARLQSIKEKMQTGYYNSDAVITKVAEEILKEISGE
ncbi:MAG: flagellar biosynthesis anti-sigma factor FlgM [Melioribacteraceae bacterium]|nr:flagellar biosynthesis anti-sigma factor FlgM [Melioribacteraceae bacterium]